MRQAVPSRTTGGGSRASHASLHAAGLLVLPVITNLSGPALGAHGDMVVAIRRQEGFRADHFSGAGQNCVADFGRRRRRYGFKGHQMQNIRISIHLQFTLKPAVSLSRHALATGDTEGRCHVPGPQPPDTLRQVERATIRRDRAKQESNSGNFEPPWFFQRQTKKATSSNTVACLLHIWTSKHFFNIITTCQFGNPFALFWISIESLQQEGWKRLSVREVSCSPTA